MISRSEFLLRVPERVALLLSKLHPEIKKNLRFGLKEILKNSSCGKSLVTELEGLCSYRVKRFRIIYRILVEDKVIEIIAIGPRRDIYEKTYKILTKEP